MTNANIEKRLRFNMSYAARLLAHAQEQMHPSFPRLPSAIATLAVTRCRPKETILESLCTATQHNGHPCKHIAKHLDGLVCGKHVQNVQRAAEHIAVFGGSQFQSHADMLCKVGRLRLTNQQANMTLMLLEITGWLDKHRYEVEPGVYLWRKRPSKLRSLEKTQKTATRSIDQTQNTLTRSIDQTHPMR